MDTTPGLICSNRTLPDFPSVYVGEIRVGDSFEEIATRFLDMEKKVQDVDNNFKKLDWKMEFMEVLEKRVNVVEEKVDNMRMYRGEVDALVNRLAEEVGEVVEAMSALVVIVGQINKKVLK